MTARPPAAPLLSLRLCTPFARRTASTTAAAAMTFFLLPALPAVAGAPCAASACCRATSAATPTLLATHRRIEHRASVFTSSRQENAATAVAPDGRTVVVWESRRQEAGSVGLFAQAFDAQGRPVGGEVHVNQTLPGMQRRPDIIAHPETGHIWIAWESTGQDGDGSSLVLRRFDDASLAGASDEIAVNVTRAGDQSDPVITALDGGRVMVAWRHAGDDLALSQAILTRVFNADGTAGDEQVVTALSEADTAADGVLGYPAIAGVSRRWAVATYGALVTWSAFTGSDETYRIHARWLDNSGEPTGEPFVLSNGEADAIEPAVTLLRAGEVAVAWQQATQEAGATGYDIVVRTIAIHDVPAQFTEPVTVATANDGWKNGVDLSSLGGGRILVAYNSTPDQVDATPDVLARIVERDGRVSDSFVLTSATEGEQSLTSARAARRLATGPDGRIAAAWFGNADQGDGSAANVTFFIPNNVAEAVSADASDPATENVRLAWTDVKSDDFLQAPIPPIWDPNWRPNPPLLNPQGDGPDFGFEGVPGTGWTPPDPEMAVGLDHIVIMTNGQIACFLKNGTNLWRDQIENSFGFWGSLGANNFVFDPEVAWDPHAQRFLAMACERSDNGRSNFLLAVSMDARPETANDWWKYRLDVTSLAGNDIDSPNMAVNRDFITLTADFFNPDKYLVYMIDKNSVLSGGTPVTRSELITGTQSYGIPVMWDGDTSVQYMVQSTENRSGDNTTVIFHALRNPFGNYSRTTYTLTVPAYRFPTQPPQRGTSTRPFLFEPRFWSCQQQNGSIWAVHHVNQTRVRARWYEFGMNNWPSGGNPEIVQWGEIDLGGTLHSFFPSIAVDDAGNAAITYARSSSDEYISMGRVVRGASDAPGTFREPTMVVESGSPDTSGRWGDYSFTQADPAQANTFWGHHEFKPVNSGWRTWVAQYQLSGMSLSLSPDPIRRGSNATAAVTGATPNQRVYVAYSLAGLGSTPVPQLNVVLDLNQPRQAGSALADGGGAAAIVLSVPPGAPLVPVWIQAAEQGSTSNVVSTSIVP